MSIKEEKAQYELIQKFLTNDKFHFNHLLRIEVIIVKNAERKLMLKKEF